MKMSLSYRSGRVALPVALAAMLLGSGLDAAERPSRGKGKFQPSGPSSLADLMGHRADAANRLMPDVPRVKIDEARVAREGIRKLAGRRLVLYTDLPSSPEIDALPDAFDQAFPQWCAYFGIDPADHADWRMTGSLMREKVRFVDAGLLPKNVPSFQNGYCRNYELWLFEQPTDYYRRHLLLHEGVHGLMNTLLGGCGPPWYMEGTAELLSTHRWQDGRLTVNHMPIDRDEVPHWGRVRIIQDEVAQRRAMRLPEVVEYSYSAHLNVEPYAWCWAAAVLMDRHPAYQDRFRQLFRNVLQPDFNERFYAVFKDDWQPLCEQWQLMIASMEYGYDVARTAIDFTPGEPLASDRLETSIAADRGWQNTGIRLESETGYRIRAAGRYQLGTEPQTWWCEPGGVTIRYYGGRPLGILMAAVRPDNVKNGSVSPLLFPATVGLGTRLTPKTSGTLYLKINDSPAELADNAGQVRVLVERE